MSSEREKPVRRGIKEGPYLRDIPGIPEEVLTKFKTLSIATALEAASREAIEPKLLQEFLGLPDEQMDGLMQNINGVLSPEDIAEILTFRQKSRPLGARNPSSQEMRDYMIDRRFKKDSGAQ